MGYDGPVVNVFALVNLKVDGSVVRVLSAGVNLRYLPSSFQTSSLKARI